MNVRDVIKDLLQFNLDDDVIILTKEEDLLEVKGQPFPGINFGTITTTDGKTIVGIVGNYEKYRKEKPEAKEENKE